MDPKHPIILFFREIIFAKTGYKTYNPKVSAIVTAFKTWYHYLEGCKHEYFDLTYYNNLCQFIDTKSQSSC